MQIKQKEIRLVRKLRTKGLSYNEIKQQVNVSKSSISRWCKDIKLSLMQQSHLLNKSKKAFEKARKKNNEMRKKKGISRLNEIGLNISKLQELYQEKKYSAPRLARMFNVSTDYIYGLMRRYNIPRRKGSEVNYLTYSYKPQFEIKQDLTSEEEKLKVAGTMLYWAEGAKNSSGINFSNSDPKMIQLFLIFLRQICGVNNNRLRVHLYAYSNQNLDKIKTYWQKIVNIPLVQFNKPYIRQNNLNKTGRKLSYGLVQIRYNDKRLLETIRFWIGECLDKYGWAGGGVANRTRL